METVIKGNSINTDCVYRINKQTAGTKVGLDRQDLAKNCTSMLRVQVNNSEISMNGILVLSQF